MEYLKGDRVIHPSKTEWGLGEVLENSHGGKVRIFFVEGGEKTLDLKYVNPEKVDGKEAVSPALDRLGLTMAKKLEDILRASNEKIFEKTYQGAGPDVRSAIDDIVILVQGKHPDVSVYPSDKPDLRIASTYRVCATIQINKNSPYIKIDLLDVKGKLPGTSLEFRKSGDDILKSYVYLNDASGIEDAMKYIDIAVKNSRHG